jgi:anti-sigma factor RsiW
MHREIRNHIEDVLAGSKPTSSPVSTDQTQEHLSQCEECRTEVQRMREQTALLRELRAPDNFASEPRPGFYARVMERIEAEGPVSIWNLFIESAFGRRIAVASLALALLLGVYLVTSERSAQDPMVAAQGPQPGISGQLEQQVVVAEEDAPARVLTQMDQFPAGQSSEDAVLANLVSYREQ